jgi:hypothetical protein
MLLKISKKLKEIAYKVNQKALYFELEYYIKHKETHYVYTSKLPRGMGKSHVLVMLSHKYKIPIAVHSWMTQDHLNRISDDLYHCTANVIVVKPNTRGKRFDALLTEEGLTHEDFQCLIPCANYLVGYYNV